MNIELKLVREKLQTPTGLMISGALLEAALRDVFALVDELAGMRTDGEMQPDGMSGDDAASDLSAFIEQARQLSAARPDPATVNTGYDEAYAFTAGDRVSRPCGACNGTGEIIEYPPDGDERMVGCPHCGSTGEVHG